ncbi:DUF4360 domain-containing protein [Lentzea tibetensis]|uniref:DUF4360 domain-containing protein n=1 Tax=Lentzea tibetensis TaxID=2591470 RepID=A0A563EI86_9PSEU|nr:DUF4360 domain-containing protein [Lentzea tibetensis]TWP45452.1 DUF4360 domain-containing protein [Lentzea tibetensis]
MHVLATLVFALSALAPLDDPPTEPVTINVVTFNGNGCGAGGGAAVYVAPDNTEFVVLVGGNSLIRVAAGAKATPGDARRSCQLNLRVNTPPGYTYAIGKVRFQGLATIEKGATASLRAAYSFQGQGNFRDNTYRFPGPFADWWERVDQSGQPTFLPCGEKRNLTMLTEMRAAAGTSDPTTTSYLYRDAGETRYELLWKRCP